MRLYNTRTRTLEDFVPVDGKKVTMYTCGPTVYDYPHIGNWFAFIRWDILARTLQHAGYDVNWVMNITDVGHLVSDADEGEDKLEKGARREGKTAWEVADFYGKYFLEGLQRLNFEGPTLIPKATEHIAEQIAIVQKLEERQHTYVIEGDGVYFDVSTFPSYADFAKLKLDDIQAGARIGENTLKRHPADFALWKFSPEGSKRDMEWDSPWGKGFPGWHIECSAMSMKYLGETMDIHAGGIDHIPVHHTNEIAQSEAATGKRFSNYWVHSNFITVDGKKISKSLGNLVTLEDIEKKGYDLSVLRLFVLESHYQSEALFSWEGMEAAKNRLQGYAAMADLRHQPIESATPFSYSFDPIATALQDNLGTPGALSALSQIATSVLESLVSKEAIEQFTAFLQQIDEAFGLSLAIRRDITDDQKAILEKRATARTNKDWQAADQLREDLLAQQISVRDTSHGQIWTRL